MLQEGGALQQQQAPLPRDDHSCKTSRRYTHNTITTLRNTQVYLGKWCKPLHVHSPVSANSWQARPATTTALASSMCHACMQATHVHASPPASCPCPADRLGTVLGCKQHYMACRQHVYMHQHLHGTCPADRLSTPCWDAGLPVGHLGTADRRRGMPKPAASMWLYKGTDPSFRSCFLSALHPNMTSSLADSSGLHAVRGGGSRCIQCRMLTAAHGCNCCICGCATELL